jgi:two-component system sensor histidine kinase PilS (NtrC family)
MLARLVTVTLILGSALVFNITESKSLGSPEYIGLTTLIIATYTSTIGYVMLIRRGFNLATLSLVQVGADAVLITGVVFLTSGVDSIFTFLYFLSIFSGATLLGRRGAMFAASASSIGIGLTATIQFTASAGLLEMLPQLSAARGRVPVYVMLIHLVAFYTVAFLSGYLTEKLGQVGSELERRQLDLRALRALNDDIIRSVDTGLIALDDQNRILFANDAADRITEQPLTAMVFHRLGDRLPELVGALERLTRRGERYREDLLLSTLASPDARFVSISLSPLRNAVGQPSGWIVLLEDVTQIRALKEEVEQQQRLASLGNMAAGIAHEIRNPLAAISGSAEMLKMNADLADDDKELLDIVLREVDRLNGLIREFLDYARPRSIHLRQTELTGMVRELVRIFIQDHELVGTSTITLDAPEEGSVVALIDPDRIRQVIWNLLRNAFQASPPSSTILVRIHRETQTPMGDSARISIEDEGAGLTPETLEKIFEPFFTTKFDGTGLGLATSHRVVSEHGGQLRAENRPSGGARFTLVLPLDLRSSTTGHLGTSDELALSSAEAPQQDKA